MKYVKFKEAVELLNSGWDIFTSRGTAPYEPIYYHLYNKEERKAVHFKTIEKLIRDGVINGTDGANKYELKTK